MPPTRKSLSPFVGKAKLHVHKGKGATQTGSQKPDRAEVASLTAPGQPPAGINDYAKQTPMPSAPAPVGPPGLGSGSFTGFGS